ncbi:MAG: glycosyltransferase family 4 protein [Candidatus Binatia bacterium]
MAHKRLDLRGGTERVLYRTAEGLKDRGHEIHLFCAEFRIPPPPGTSGHRVPCLAWPRTARLLTFAFLTPKVIARYPCDVVMSFDRMTKQDLFRSGGGSHRVFLQRMTKNSARWRKLWYQISPYHRCVLAIEKRQVSSDGCHKIMAVYQQGKREIMEAYGVPEEKVVIIYNGVDHERFHPRRRLEEGRRIREGLGIPLDGPVVIFVGTGFRRKGLDRLLDLWGSRELQGIYLLVVGNDARLSYYRNRWNRSAIFFVGPQFPVEDYYAAADLFVLPSIQEAFGNVVLEALASGLPVITIPGVGAAEQIEGDLREGILVNPGDPEELKKRILRLLDKDRWPNLSRAARQVAEKYSWPKYFAELEKQLNEIARRN